MKMPLPGAWTLELDRIPDGEVVLYPYARSAWFLLERLEEITDKWGDRKIWCEVLKCSEGPMQGHRSNISPGARVVRLTEMEILGLMAL